MSDLEDLQTLVIARDLSRRPELAHVAKMLYFVVNNTPPVANDIPPLFLKLAKELVDNQQKRQNFLMALDFAVVRT